MFGGGSGLVENLLRSDAVRARDAMTPLTVVVAADQKQRIDRFNGQHPSRRLSRIAVFDATIDPVSRFVICADLLAGLVEGNQEMLRKDLKCPVATVDEFDRTADRQRLTRKNGEARAQARGLIETGY